MPYYNNLNGFPFHQWQVITTTSGQNLSLGNYRKIWDTLTTVDSRYLEVEGTL